MTSTSDVLGRFWAEAVEMVTTERQAHENEKRAQLVAAKDLIAETVPADVLAALGLDVSTAVMPAQYDGAVVDGSCVFEGERLNHSYGFAAPAQPARGEPGGWREVGGDRREGAARVGLALGQAVQARSAERKEAGESLVRKAQTWAGCDGSAESQLRWDKLPHVPARRSREARRIVAGRKWQERKDAWARAHQRRAARRRLEERCGLLIGGGGEWLRWRTSTRRRARRGEGLDGSARAQLREAGAVAGDVCADDPPGEGEDEDWTATTVVMEAPEALAAFRTLVPVTEVRRAGR